MTISLLAAPASGLVASQTSLEVVSNNLANTNTTAFKRSNANFQDLFYNGSNQLQIGIGAKVSSISKDFTQGTALATNGQLDVLINGQGFFQVQTADGQIGYSRDGSFNLNANGEIVNDNGLRIFPTITIPSDATSVDIAEDGTVSVTQSGVVGSTVVGQIETARFINPVGLASSDGSLFFATSNSGDPMVGIPGTDALGTLQQGALEGSNVDVAFEFVDLIIAQRSFQFNSRAFQVADEMVTSSLNLVDLFG